MENNNVDYIPLEKNEKREKMKNILVRMDRLFNLSWIFIVSLIISGVFLGVCYESIHCQFKY